VVWAGEAEAALEAARDRGPHLVLVDLDLPALGGLSIVERLRACSPVPIIALSAPCAEDDKIRAFDGGADDYVTKPLALGEFLARVRALLRRAALNPAVPPPGGGLLIDLAKRYVAIAGRSVKLTRTEYELLACLAGTPEKAFSHAELLRQVWGPEYERENEYLHTFVAQLRRKIEADPSHPRYILTESRYGYRLCLAP
jgi:two-component system, OmpR family, KDP operon response regulator KdpE